ncbi:hypothetical protein HPB47_004739 [Ixodes persulcatus]|uniref:Uncharacterized protein n=1 Tax=Ixodes persulcatus TaxID=34615 RepID=A0AC60PEZ8_IXOPE|nr:hypothetical protein HPB47_004739 [Ixodes persulcatus]
MFAAVYSELFRREDIDNDITDSFLKDLPQVSEEHKDRMDQPISAAELEPLCLKVQRSQSISGLKLEGASVKLLADEYVDGDNPEWAQPDERGRKHRRSSDKWKRNVSKMKRNQGEKYTNAAGRIGVSSAKAKDVRKLLRYVSAGKRSALEEYLQHINGVADNENGFDVDD